MSLQLLSSNTEETKRLQVFEDGFSGHHRISLEKPYGLDRVSKHLCGLLGYSAEELRLKFGEDCSLMVCQPDRGKYLRFLDALAEKEQTLSLRYQMQKKDGTLLQVCDTTTSCRLMDGKMYGFAIVSDVSDWPDSKPVGDLFSSLLPYGYMQCTCEKYPRITYINEAMSDYLYLDKQPNRWQPNARDNIYFMLPFEDREHFRQYLEEAKTSSKPISIDHHLFRSDGSKAHLTGWLSMVPGDAGQEEFALIYRQVEDVTEETEPVQDTSYFPVLKRSYTAIFELDLENSMAECIHGLDNSPIGSLYGIQMTLESAKQICLNNYIFPEDRPMMTAYLDQISDPEDDWNGRSVLQAEFRLKGTSGLLRFIGVAVHLDANQVLLCCRDITNLTYTGAQALENKTLHTIYDWMDYLSTSGENTVGMLMLDETPAGCSLLYGSSSVLHYLGLDTEESPHRSTQPTLAECLEAADLTQEEFDQLVAGKNLTLWSRSAPDAFQFQLTCKTYTREDRTLYIIWCSHMDPPEELENAPHVFARTFGHFDLFLDNTPITFSSGKEKELMALLIDRNGGTLSPNEAISYLWEDEVADERTSARYRKLAMGLKRTLRKYGIENILINHNGIRSIDTSAIRCDYYELLAGNAKYRQAFHNAYMTDYSWGEETLASLWNYSSET
jgi:hypothetical protein